LRAVDFVFVAKNKTHLLLIPTLIKQLCRQSVETNASFMVPVGDVSLTGGRVSVSDVSQSVETDVSSVVFSNVTLSSESNCSASP
jgi:hypothetical protein